MRRLLALTGAAMMALAPEAWSQQQGGTLRLTHRDSPASLSIHEEGTNSVITPVMSLFNNLVMYDQSVKQNTMTPSCPIWRRPGAGMRTAPS